MKAQIERERLVDISRSEIGIDIVRQLHRGGGRRSDGSAETLAADDASPLELALRTETRQRVEAALRLLPDAFREVVVLREIEGFGYEEIAEILNVNLGTVKSRLTRGRTALREALKNKELEKAGPTSSTALNGTLEAVI